MDEDGLPIVGSGVDLTKVSIELTVASQANVKLYFEETGRNSSAKQLSFCLSVDSGN